MTERPSFLAELKRRNVIRVAIAYVAVSWLALQACALLVQMLELPNAISKGLFVLLVVAFIPALVFSWVYELTPEGLKRESEIEREESITHLTGRRLDYLVIGVMAAVIALLVVDKFVLTPRKAARVVASAASVAPEMPAAATPGTKAAPSQNSIAVLPFVNMSSDKEQEYFSDGISEELLNLLAKIPQLQVTARTSSFAFKGTKTGIPEIARTLNVAHVLEGSVRKSGDSVRVTAQLIKAETGNHLWSHTYDRTLEDIFAIQDEIAADVVTQLKVTLLGAAPKVRTTDPDAYAQYLQAVQLGRQNTAESLEQAEALLGKALKIDPDYAPAWVALGQNFTYKATLGVMPSKEAYAASRAALMKALAIEPEYAPAHARLGYLASSENDLDGAAQHLRRALELDPMDVDVLRDSAVLLGSLGRMEEGLAHLEAAVRRDPVNLTALSNLGLLQRQAGRFDASIATYRTVLSLAPSRGSVHASLAIAMMQKGDAAAALAEIEQEGSEIWKMIGLPMVYHALGRKQDSDVALQAVVGQYEKDAAFNIAHIHAFRGDADQAFAWLEKAVEYGDPGLADIPVEPLFDKIRDDPRWLPFLREVGLAPEQLAKIEFKVTPPQ